MLEQVGYPPDAELAERARRAGPPRRRAGLRQRRDAVGHYFTTPRARSAGAASASGSGAADWTFATANGVFSADGLDLGTAVLPRTPRPDAARLDLGCGYGPIAVRLATACPGATVDAVDVNERALALTRDNADAHGVGGRVRALLPADADPGRPLRRDLVQPADPRRQGSPASCC